MREHKMNEFDQMKLIESDEQMHSMLYAEQLDYGFFNCIIDSPGRKRYNSKDGIRTIVQPQMSILKLQALFDEPEANLSEIQAKIKVDQKTQVNGKNPQDSIIKQENINQAPTRAATKIEEDQCCDMQDRSGGDTVLIQQSLDLKYAPQSLDPQKKDKHKFNKKSFKYVFCERNFKKTQKISFPKKIVQMFINHFQQLGVQDEYVLNYNYKFKQQIKKNKKNDYTFDKEVLQILGELNEVQNQVMRKRISLENRKTFVKIVRDTMKNEVIMRDKIAKNRELYMTQLKVYALRCQSHRLAKKGTFK